MHVHLPKPLHGWRAFIGEVGIIVLGVLIALGAEQAVESARWAARAHAAKLSLHKQMVLAWVFAEERQARQECADRYLDDLAKAIVESTTAWQARRADYCGQRHSTVYVAPVRPWPTEEWQSLEAEGTVSHLGDQYSRQASFLFNFIKTIRDQNAAETSEAASLEALSYPVALTADSKIDFLKTIQHLRYENGLLALESRQIQNQIRRLHETPTGAELSVAHATVPFFHLPVSGVSRPV